MFETAKTVLHLLGPGVGGNVTVMGAPLDTTCTVLYVVELEKSFQEWCNTWGPFRSRRVSDRAEDLRPRAIRERLSLGRSTPRGRARPGYLLNYLINYLIIS